MKLLKHCAEAKLYFTQFLGQNVLLKERVEKGYRNKELNEGLIGSRVVRECNLISRAKSAGVRTPVLYKVEKEKGRIWMEFIAGRQLKEVLGEEELLKEALCEGRGNKRGKGNGGKLWERKSNRKGRKYCGILGEEMKGKYCKVLGKEIAKLHSEGIVHGDLTTSNVLIHNKGLVFLDFGLGFFSKKEENFAVDLLNLKKTFLATHADFEQGWEEIEEGYCKGFATGRRILEKLEEIEGRVRYR